MPTTQQITQDRSREEQLARLNSEHRAIKARLRELDPPRSLSSAERVERAQLQKRKLVTHDRILRLRSH